MDTAALRPLGTIVHEAPPRRDDVTGSPATTDLPTEKTVQATQATRDGTAADNRRNPGDQTSRSPIRTGFERDLATGSVVYRWVDQATDRVLLEIPRSDKIRSRQIYQDQGQDHAATATPSVDRSV